MSDERGKTRRNLVVYCAGVLGIGALGIPLEGSKFLGLDLSNVEPIRIWGVSVIVLGYLILRFLNDPDVKTLMSAWNATWKDILIVEVETLILAEFRRWRETGKSGVNFEISPAPQANANATIDGRLTTYELRHGFASIRWTRTVDRNGRSEEEAIPPNGRIKYRIPTQVSGPLALRVVLRHFKLDWHFCEIVLPILLATVTALYCIVRLLIEAIGK